MQVASESPLLSETEAPAVRVLNANGSSPVVLVCEHASRFVPASLNGLGLTEEAAQSHAAWDIGAMDLAVELMGALDAPLVASRISRLVYDCNRPPSAPDAMPLQSEKFTVPGNAELDESSRAARVREVYEPFRDALAALLNDRETPPVLVTIHSFTPIYQGQVRQVELGILHDTDDRAAQVLLDAAHAQTPLNAAMNEPYSATDGVTHTLREHGGARGIPNVMIEIRNDLVDTPTGVNRIAGLLAPLLQDMADACLVAEPKQAQG